MATENRENDNNAAPPSLSKRGLARRRLTRAGLGAAGGLLATLDSKSAMATMMCKSPSGSLSGGISSHYGSSAKCEGLTPSQWKDSGSWPCSKDTMFCHVFYADSNGAVCPTRKSSYTNQKDGSTHYDGGSYYCCKLSDLLNQQSCDKNSVGMHMVAAYLNVASGKVNVITTTQLQNMWYELQTTGRFSPTAGTYWTSAQVANYLATYINI